MRSSDFSKGYELHSYIARLSLNKASTVIGWFLVTSPDHILMYLDQDTIAQLPARRKQPHVFAIWLFKGKSKYIAKHLVHGHSGN